MARRALPHRMCDQRVPVDDMILKIAAGNPQGRISAKKTFEYFSSFEKYFVVPWMASKNAMDGKYRGQARATSKKNKKKQKDPTESQSTPVPYQNSAPDPSNNDPSKPTPS